MTYEPPPRLKYGDEFGPLLRAADVVDVSAERIAGNAAGYKALIAMGATTALWKALLPLVLLLGVLAPVIDRATTPVTETAITGGSPEHAQMSAEAPDSHATLVAHETIIGLPAAEPPVVIVRPPPPKPAPVIAQLATPPAVPAPSELPEQIRLYEEARDAGRRRDYATGVTRIDELLTRFPASPLRAEAELTRAEYLARANRVDDASRALEALIGNDAHRGRRGELLRTLGDLYRRQGDCTRARDAYNRALALRLSDRDRETILKVRASCGE